MKISDAKTIRSIDSRAMRLFGIRGLQLMENAGKGVADVVSGALASSGCPRGRVSIIAGKGNNGGDGYVAARHLANSGARVAVYSLAPQDALKGDAATNAAVWRKMGGQTVTLLTRRDLKRHEADLRHSCVVVDAVFGTGLSCPVKGIFRAVIELMNGLGRTVVSVDVPSGIDATTGAVLGCAVRADVTATMAISKTGLCQYPGVDYAGRVDVVDIGVPRALVEDGSIRWNLIDAEMLGGILASRRGDSHKGTYGHLAVVAGSPGKTGAAYMAAMGAMRTGAGLVTVGVPRGLNPVMEVKTTEAMTVALPETAEGCLGQVSYAGVKALMDGKTALVFGPGLGATEDVFRLLEEVVRNVAAPMVIDADGLNCLAGRVGILKKAKAPVVLTPHPGEMARLLKTTAAAVQADRMAAAGELSKRSSAVVVLKGAATVVASPGGQIYINPTGSASLATAGTGDVLAGMIGALLCGGHGPAEAAVAAVYAHGLAADRVREANGGEAGMIATDLLGVIPGVINSLSRQGP
ncbi:MAG: NAD(P)H-hydrate dehydratase [Thermodesulfobacteriota bacterium]